MSSRSLRNRQESCTYRLNRAALMRMEEGRKKAMSRHEGGYYDNRTVCIQVDKKRSSSVGESQSNSQSDNDSSKTEEDSPLSEKGARLSTSVKHQKRKNRDNTSIRSYKPRTHRGDRSKIEFSNDKKLRSERRRKASTSYTESEVEEKELNARRIPLEVTRRRKSKVHRRQQTTQTVQRFMTAPLAAHTKFEQSRRKNYHSSSTSDQQFQQRTSSRLLNNRVNSIRNASSPLEAHKIISDPKRNIEKKTTSNQSKATGATRTESSYATETEPKAAYIHPKRNENRTFGEPLQAKQHKADDEFHEYLKGSHESITDKRRTSSRRSSSKKRSGMMRPSPGTKRIYFKPLPSTVTMNSDQEDVISKWRKRMGTGSPSPPKQRLGSPVAPSSYLRDSHIFRVQGTPTHVGHETLSSPIDLNYLIPERDPPDMSLEDLEFKNMLGSMSGKHSKEGFAAHNEQEIFLRMEMEKTRKQIYYLEELARAKVERLEAIRWKKKRALEEEAVLNDKLEKLLDKIQELRESDSYAKLLDKQTQVFATKRNRSNIK